MTSILKNVHVGKLDDIVNKYNNACHRTIKMIFTDFNKEKITEGPKFKADENINISKYKNTFAKVYVPNWFEQVSVIKKVKNMERWTYIINDVMLMEKKLLERFTKSNCKKKIKKSLELKSNKEKRR